MLTFRVLTNATLTIFINLAIARSSLAQSQSWVPKSWQDDLRKTAAISIVVHPHMANTPMKLPDSVISKEAILTPDERQLFISSLSAAKSMSLAQVQQRNASCVYNPGLGFYFLSDQTRVGYVLCFNCDIWATDLDLSTIHDRPSNGAFTLDYADATASRAVLLRIARSHFPEIFDKIADVRISPPPHL